MAQNFTRSGGSSSHCTVQKYLLTMTVCLSGLYNIYSGRHHLSFQFEWGNPWKKPRKEPQQREPSPRMDRHAIDVRVYRTEQQNHTFGWQNVWYRLIISNSCEYCGSKWMTEQAKAQQDLHSSVVTWKRMGHTRWLAKKKKKKTSDCKRFEFSGSKDIYGLSLAGSGFQISVQIYVSYNFLLLSGKTMMHIAKM